MRNAIMIVGILLGAGLAGAELSRGLSGVSLDDVTLGHGDDIASSIGKSSSLNGTVEIMRNAHGQFSTGGIINGQRIDFMIDTGATVVALNRTSAARLNLRPTPADYSETVTTANGSIKVARIQLGIIQIGGIIVRDVDAIILPDSSLKGNLLGMSFLSKLKQLKYSGDKMVLEQKGGGLQN
jgi:aspartyl protease family protein